MKTFMSSIYHVGRFFFMQTQEISSNSGANTEWFKCTRNKMIQKLLCVRDIGTGEKITRN